MYGYYTELGIVVLIYLGKACCKQIGIVLCDSGSISIVTESRKMYFYIVEIITIPEIISLKEKCLGTLLYKNKGMHYANVRSSAHPHQLQEES